MYTIIRHRRPNVQNLGPDHHYATFDLQYIVPRYIEVYMETFGEWPKKCKVSINIDGVSPFKNSAFGFWTMLLRFHGLLTGAVVPVSVVYGRGKPPTLDWLRDGIMAVRALISDGHRNLQFELANLCAGTETFEY